MPRSDCDCTWCESWRKSAAKAQRMQKVEERAAVVAYVALAVLATAALVATWWPP